jgi:hypothetical protein
MKTILKSLVIPATTLVLPGTSLAAPATSAQCQGVTAVGAPCDDQLTVNGGPLSRIIDTIFLVIGVLAVIILLVGAIRYITSTGDAKRIQQAKDTIIYAILGLIIAILARAIVGFVIGKVG